MNEENTNEGLNESDMAQIKKDMADAKANLISEETKQKIAEEKEKARIEAEKDIIINEKVKAKDQELLDAKKALENKERAFAEQMEKMQTQLDNMASSKAPVNTQNPFKSQSNQSDNPMDVEKYSDDVVQSIEQKSAEAFFGMTWEDLQRGA